VTKRRRSKLPTVIKRNRAAAAQFEGQAKLRALIVCADAETIERLARCVFHTGRTAVRSHRRAWLTTEDRQASKVVANCTCCGRPGEPDAYLATTAHHAGAVLLALESLGLHKVKSRTTVANGTIEWKVKRP
jgi:hypothetical protein